MYSADTIYAPLTPPGKAAVAVIRVSGPDSKAALQKLTGSDRAIRNPRSFSLQHISAPGVKEAAEPEVLDSALVTYFKSPNSFTGEDLFELHLHGSPYVIRRVSETLAALGVRLAEPGEFTQRAFLNGRIDLVQAEAVADLIEAETAAQAKVATQQLSGTLSSALLEIGEPLRDQLALVEAYIDFPEEDLDPGSQQSWKETIKEIRERIHAYLRSYSKGRLQRSGAKVVLAGLPNAGKSSLLNALLGESRAIVTPTAGTTRDSIDAVIDLNGLRVSLWDTAGLELEGGREIDEIERLGIERSERHIAEADLVVFLFSPDLDLSSQIQRFSNLPLSGKHTLVALSKSDTEESRERSWLSEQIKQATSYPTIEISSETGSGIEQLQKQILATLVSDSSDLPRPTHLQRTPLQRPGQSRRFSQSCTGQARRPEFCCGADGL